MRQFLIRHNLYDKFVKEYNKLVNDNNQRLYIRYMRNNYGNTDLSTFFKHCNHDWTELFLSISNVFPLNLTKDGFTFWRHVNAEMIVYFKKKYTYGT